MNIKFKKTISVLFSVIMMSFSVISALPASALSENSLESDSRVMIDQYFNGFTDELLGTSSQNSENIGSAAVIKSSEELEDYLSVFFKNNIVGEYAGKYSDDFFEENILLVNSLYQQYGSKPLLNVENVTFENPDVNISAKWVEADETDGVGSALLVQIPLTKDSDADYSVKWNITGETKKSEPSVPVGYNASGKAKRIDVTNILQNPELPTGCEVVSLTILLNHLGYNVDKLTMARNYLPKLDFYWYNGVYYGADFRTTFAGNPESKNAYGCYAPCITTTANSYFKDIGSGSVAQDLTGTNFDTLLSDYIDNDIPVLIWITSSNLHEPMLTSVWTTPEGKRVQWLAYEHCVVLTGYDMDKQIIYVSDPLVGNTSYDYGRLKQRYIDLGQQAVHIETERTGYIYGDLDDDGNVTTSDSVLVLRQIAGLENFDDIHRILADVNCDGNISTADAVEILRFNAGLADQSNVGEFFYK